VAIINAHLVVPSVLVCSIVQLSFQGPSYSSCHKFAIVRQGAGLQLCSVNTRYLDSALTRPHESKAGELRKTPEGRLRGIEAETKVFLSVIVVLVRGLMVVRI